MTKTMSILAAAMLLCGSVFAAPVALSNAQLDGISAGETVFDYVFGTPGGVNQASDNGATMAAEATFSAADNGANAITGDDNDVTSAVASDGSVANNGDFNDFNAADASGGANAVSGDDNTAIAVTLTDNTLTVNAPAYTADDDSAIATDTATLKQNQADDGSAIATDTATATVKDFIAIDNEDSNVNVGEGNTQTIDAPTVLGEIEEGGMGQIAYCADASNAFNVTEIELDVEVEVEDSFNTTTNTMDISGQGTVTAIVNANALDDQNIGVNVAITSATSSAPAPGTAGADAVASTDGNAQALATLSQYAYNNVLILGGVSLITGLQ